MLYYIAIHDAGRSALIAGPYATEHEAQSQMGHVQHLAYEADPWSWFYTYSLARTETRYKTRFGPATAERATRTRASGILAGTDRPG